ncbi:GNAT family N-acetyltransferase [Planococcus sp. CAU13]|uniref:GNAT family N-acetyltransferase n=1 Tax=Planococcus sp. CAU13 TaxID=1541197 RepID=UPI00052FEC21|nr:GNAT family N-acetyltransferase [Planococcus sp. CAU13]
MLIRKADNNETETIKNMRLSSYAQYKNDISLEHWDMLQGTLTSNGDQQTGTEIFVAEIDGRIAGSAVLFPSESKAYEWDTETIKYPEIRMLAVNPDYRSKGVGRALVRHCIDSARQQQYKFVGLHTGSFMKDAISLYEKMGFKRVPELDFVPFNDGITVKAFRYDI